MAADYLSFALSLAEQAGKIMRDSFTLGMKRRNKADLSPVTDADIAINKLVIAEVRRSYPAHSVKGEEESSQAGDGRLVWVCDPIDGTIPFSSGVPTCAFSLALVEDGIPILGVAFDPFMNRLYYAEKGRGAFLNDEPISVSKQAALAAGNVDLEVVAHSCYAVWGIDRRLAEVNARVICFCSIVYGSLMVANGEFCGAIFTHDTAHDIAAVKVIIEEAGGKVTDLWGREQRYDGAVRGAVLSNGLVHDALLQIVGDSMKQQGDSGVVL